MNYIVDLTSWIVIAWLSGLFLEYVWNAFLTWRDKKYVLEHEDSAIDEILDLYPCASKFFTKESLHKSLKYERSCDAFNSFRSKVSKKISFALVLFGANPALFDFFSSYLSLDYALSAALAFTIITIVVSLLNIPFDYVNDFVVEESFGFNKKSIKTFISDFIKNISLSSIMIMFFVVVAWSILGYTHHTYGKIDIITSSYIAAGFTLFLMAFELVQIEVITPMFNELTPLEDGDLKSKIECLLKKFGYNPKGVYVMDASRRTSHSNAYCAGWGRSKKLVLFDTLLDKFSDDEILAIIGHELAHSKLWHLPVNRCIEAISTFLFIYLASMFIYSPEIYNAFGWRMVNGSNVISFALIGVVVFQDLFNSVSWVFNGIISCISRKMEFAADAMSCAYIGSCKPMMTALFKLYNENLSFPLSDNWYESWHFSHPGFINRITALKHVEDTMER